MPTLKKNNPSSETAIVRFSVGVAETLAADNARGAINDEVLAFRAFYDAVVVAHALPLSALLPRAKDQARRGRSNAEQAAYDFGTRMFYTYLFGADIAGQITDRNVKADTVLPLSQFLSRKTAKPYKDQAKRAVAQSFGGTPWKDFVTRLCDLESDDIKTAKIAAGLMTEADDTKMAKIAAGLMTEAEAGEKRGVRSRSTEYGRVLKSVGEVVKLLRREPEKRDGSMNLETAKKFAAYLVDGLAQYGIK